MFFFDETVGIYREYEDTKDAIKEKKIDTGLTTEERRLARARAQPTDKGFVLDQLHMNYSRESVD